MCFDFQSVRFGSTEIFPDQAFQITADQIISNDFKTGLQLFRCFGREIFSAEIFGLISTKEEYEKHLKRNRKLYTYINNYCGEYLKELTISRINIYRGESYAIDILKYFLKPFTKLLRFPFNRCNFTKNICLEKIFPNLQELHCTHNANECLFYSTNTEHFPHLKSFNMYTNDFSGIEIGMIVSFLQLNPQIKDLSFSSMSKLDINLIRYSADSLQNVETLFLNIKPMTIIGDNDTAIYMKSVKNFNVFCKQSDEFVVRFLPFSFQQLETFAIALPGPEFQSSFTEEFKDFIIRHPTIKYLETRRLKLTVDIDWLGLASLFPSLVENHSPLCRFSIDESMELMSACQMLEKFYFRLNGDYHNFCSRLNTECE